MNFSAIPEYPLFASLNMNMKEELDFILSSLPDGVSEFSFLNLYLFRNTYQYSASIHNGLLIIKGIYKNEPFFTTPCGDVEPAIVMNLLKEVKKWNGIAESFLKTNEYVFQNSELKNLNLQEDRDNFDYVYLRESLAKLEGKELHKKRTHINKFERTYSNIRVAPLLSSNINDAYFILDEWQKEREEKDDSDFNEAKEGLSLLKDERFLLEGIILYIDETPVAWTLAEIMREKKCALVIFEKAVSKYAGSFQYVNYALANFLSEDILYINREQDLGNLGLRQAKMTYRPIKFVKKYKITV